jgi:hypothetical protein
VPKVLRSGTEDRPAFIDALPVGRLGWPEEIATYSSTRSARTNIDAGIVV